MSYRIDRMASKHVPEVVAIEKVCNKAPWSEGSFRAEISNKQARYVVAIQKDEVIGYGGYWAIVDEAHITNLAVHPEHRRKGLARKLMVRLLKEAKADALTCSTLEVRAGNEAAITLYEKLGYERCGIRKRYYPNDREDAVVMWLYNLQEREY